MWVAGLRLTDFRSHENVDLELTRGVTAFVGANGQGKTNLVEAIEYASVLGSHRVATDAPLVRDGADRAIVGVDVVRADRTVVIEIEINPGRANRARVNRAPVTRARDVLGLLTTVMFAPEDLALVKGDPSDRRRFLDDLLVQRSPRLQAVRSDYERVLKQRNALLKSAGQARRAGPAEVGRTLDVWDEQLATHGGELIAARIALLDEVRPLLAASYAVISGTTGSDGTAGRDGMSGRGEDQSDTFGRVAVGYHSAIGPDVPESTDRQWWRDTLLAAVTERRREELDRGITLVGPQRDDLHITLGGLPAKGYASHGESWSIALGLRLASLDLLRQDGEDPVLVLDDVFAELDAARRRRLVEQVVDVDQVLITAAVAEDVPVELDGARVSVRRGQVGDA